MVATCLVYAAGTTSTNDLSTEIYATGVKTLTGGTYKIKWTGIVYTNLTKIEVQLYTTTLSVSCRVYSTVATFTTNDGANALASISPWKQLTCTVDNTNAIIFPFSVAAGDYIEIWNPQVAGVNVSLKLR